MRLEEIASVRSDHKPGRNALGPGPFVGRRAELARLRRGVELALRGMGTCAWIVGESGSGKTRLARELASYARLRGFRVRWLGHAEVRAARPTVAPPAAGAELLIADGFPDAGPTSVRAVERLLARAGPRQLVLGTSRPPLDGLATLLAERRADVLILTGLETDALARLLGALSGETPAVEVTAAVARATGGNPSRVRAWLEADRAGMS